MKRFEYKITHHAGDEFLQMVYFCSDQGECTISEVPNNQNRVLVQILNEQGDDGWELVQAAFGKDGVMAFWKRRVKQKK